MPHLQYSKTVKSCVILQINLHWVSLTDSFENGPCEHGGHAVFYGWSRVTLHSEETSACFQWLPALSSVYSTEERVEMSGTKQNNVHGSVFATHKWLNLWHLTPLLLRWESFSFSGDNLLEAAIIWVPVNLKANIWTWALYLLMTVCSAISSALSPYTLSPSCPPPPPPRVIVG